ncbi:MAG: ferredoxin [Patescibacteria group bacterium]
MSKIVLQREKCIGCGSCEVVCPKYFELTDDGKAHIKDSVKDEKTDKEELEVVKIECAESAVESCPVQCIEII